MAAAYQARRDVAVETLRALGWPVRVPKAAMYLWLRIPYEVGEWEFVRGLIDEVGVVVTPGVAFGPGGRGYFRLSLVAEPDVLRKAIVLMGQVCLRRGWYFP
jgi:LL-diaminopimelate aminotransferase